MWISFVPDYRHIFLLIGLSIRGFGACILTCRVDSRRCEYCCSPSAFSFFRHTDKLFVIFSGKGHLILVMLVLDFNPVFIAVKVCPEYTNSKPQLPFIYWLLSAIFNYFHHAFLIQVQPSARTIVKGENV